MKNYLIFFKNVKIMKIFKMYFFFSYIKHVIFSYIKLTLDNTDFFKLI